MRLLGLFEDVTEKNCRVDTRWNRYFILCISCTYILIDYFMRISSKASFIIASQQLTEPS